ncbi:VOC family protein [Saxibacter everestensis]|uniref:Putative pterin-4-alpha-carbinolamine dehydratase n=1 Tax=Saxibacter everestensis TaxID=2909229 RepID=A0ABY8QQ51_9MICO|nr:VOC family protein [Brevibacteriaceae bacterium ZFBP1038]
MQASSAPVVLSPGDTSATLESSAFTHLAGSLYARYLAPDFVTAAKLVSQVADIAEGLNHHPDIEWKFRAVAFTLTTHDQGGVTETDLDLAAKIQEIADSLDAAPQRITPAKYELAIDAVDPDAIRDFWRAGLNYVDKVTAEGAVDLADPLGVGPTVWFQQMAEQRSDRNRVHLDVYVPTTHAETRVAEVLEAGGYLVTDEHAPDWWVLADAEGNELCVCTSAT